MRGDDASVLPLTFRQPGEHGPLFLKRMLQLGQTDELLLCLAPQPLSPRAQHAALRAACPALGDKRLKPIDLLGEIGIVIHRFAVSLVMVQCGTFAAKRIPGKRRFRWCHRQFAAKARNV